MKKGPLYLIFVLLFVIGCGKSNDGFVQCLNEKGAVMYGTSWCPACTAQKEIFGRSFNLVNYVDCDLDSQKCNEEEISSIPTWIIGEKRIQGTQELWQLAAHSGCSLEED